MLLATWTQSLESGVHACGRGFFFQSRWPADRRDSFSFCTVASYSATTVATVVTVWRTCTLHTLLGMETTDERATS